MSELRTGYEVDEQGVAVLRLQRPDARNAMDTQMLVEILEHLAVARDDEAVRVLVISSSDHMGLSAGADIKEAIDEQSKVRADAALRRRLRPDRRLPEADDRGLPRRRRRRRRRGRDRLRHAGRRLQPADALPGRGARRPGRPRPPGHPLRPRRRQVPAPLLAHRRRRRGAAPRPRQPGRPGGGDRGGGAGARRRGRRPPAGGSRPPEADAARVGRRRGPLARPRARARSSGSAPARACRAGDRRWRSWNRA